MKRNKGVVLAILVMLCALISGFVREPANPKNTPIEDFPESEAVSGEYVEENDSEVIGDKFTWKNESKQALLDCYMGYLTFIKSNDAISVGRRIDSGGYGELISVVLPPRLCSRIGDGVFPAA